MQHKAYETLETDKPDEKEKNYTKRNERPESKQKQTRQIDSSQIDLIQSFIPSPETQSNPYYIYLPTIQTITSKLVQKNVPVASDRYVFSTILSSEERLDIRVSKENNRYHIELFADKDLSKFLSDKIGALKQHLKKTLNDKDDYDIDILAIEESYSKINPDTPVRKVTFKPSEAN